MGVEAFKAELEKRCGFAFEESQRLHTSITGRITMAGTRTMKQKWYYTVFSENGRIIRRGKGGHENWHFLEIAKTGKANFRFTCNQNVIISDIDPKDKKAVEDILEQFGIIAHTDQAGPVRRSAVACVAFNTCPLALAEAQRYLPTLIDQDQSH